ncbi:MAG: class II fructose-bisphosphatase [Bacillota bacterium]
MQRELAIEFVRVTEAAALAAAPWMGKGQKESADGAAVDAMRRMFDTVHINGIVVIGEGEKDEAPRLFIGEKIGEGDEGPELDIAVDPVEGTTLVARGLPNALSVVAVADRGTLLKAPDIYMQKISVGPAAKGMVNIDASIEDNLRATAEALNKSVKDLTVIILDRERHADIIEEVRAVGARIKLIADGDVAGGISTAQEDTGIDMCIGIGGATEGVLTAAALRCLGGEIQARLIYRDEKDKQKARDLGITNLDKIYKTEDLAAGEDIMFAVTGITDGELLPGVRYQRNSAKTSSIVMRSKTGTIRYINAEHKITQKPDYFPKDIFNIKQSKY